MEETIVVTAQDLAATLQRALEAVQSNASPDTGVQTRVSTLQGLKELIAGHPDDDVAADGQLAIDVIIADASGLLDDENDEDFELDDEEEEDEEGDDEDAD